MIQRMSKIICGFIIYFNPMRVLLIIVISLYKVTVMEYLNDGLYELHYDRLWKQPIFPYLANIRFWYLYGCAKNESCSPTLQ